ncbi:hypothetical protein SK137_0033 [Streptococcus mitis]|nr:hypothetical protein SK137_0033 [Streptococcus mitis]
MWLKSFKQNKDKKFQGICFGIFFGSSDRLGTDLVFLGTVEI